MNPTPLQRWRTLRSETARFDAVLNRYRHLVEGGDTGFAEKSSALDKAAIQADPKDDAKLKKKIEARALEAKKSRIDTLKRMRELAALDFGMVGGVAPVGSMSGAGGSDGARPTSISPRT
jgi:hypothetical protein